MLAVNDNKSDLLSRIARSQNERTAIEVARLFNVMSLPIPQEGEFTTTREFDYMLFLNDAASVIRLTSDRENPHVVHDHILQPYGSLKAKDMRMEFFPGVHSPVKDGDEESLELTLLQDRIGFDSTTLNCGYIPGLTNNESHCVVIDQGGIIQSLFDRKVHDLHEIFSNFTSQLWSEKITPIQTKHYRPLRESFRQVWPSPDTADPSKLPALWNTCRTMKNQGRIIAGWMEHYSGLPPSEFRKDGDECCDSNSRDYKNMVAGSSAYAKRWTMPISAPILAMAA